MNVRLWYPQLDVYDTARRMAVLLQYFGTPPGIERLCIADFYLANPPLLHGTSMPQDTRRRFRELDIPRPQNMFVSYPAAPILFHKMGPIQRQALLALRGRALIAVELLESGKVALTARGIAEFHAPSMCSNAEANVAMFLAQHFSADEELGNWQLRLQTGLRRPS